VQELARERSPEAINTLAAIMDDTKAPPAARVAAANSLLDRGYPLRAYRKESPTMHPHRPLLGRGTFKHALW